MLTKLEIKGTLKVVTGLHIGASNVFSAIGAVDSPIMRDTISDLPIIPGSSIKGKIRALLAKDLNGSMVRSHNADDERILRLFGSSERGNIRYSRLIFLDSVMDNMEQLRRIGIERPTEVKFENSINRLTAVANPRQIERIVRGAEFPISIIYNALEENFDQIEDDIDLLARGLQLLTYDYLGGNGSRGYGRIELEGLTLQVVVGELDEKLLSKCRTIIEGISNEL